MRLRVSRRVEALIAGVVAVSALGVVLAHNSAVVQRAFVQRLVPVVMVAKAVQPLTPITAADLQVTRMAGRPPGAFSSVSQAVGREATVGLVRGQVLFRQDVARLPAGGVPQGYREVGIRAGLVRSAGVKPGDLVDVLVIYKLQGSRKAVPPAGAVAVPGGYAVDVAPGARVVAVRDQQGLPVSSPLGHSDRTAASQSVSYIPNEVTLLVPKAEAPAVALGSELGAVHLLVK